ncbi:MAG: rhodanese-like domain-containing protein [Pseudomonadota bacterium]
MRPTLASLTALVLLLLCALPAPAREASRASTIEALEAQEMLAQEPKNTFLVDSRNRAEYMLLGHPPQAYNVPWRFLTSDFQMQGGPFQGGKAPYTGYQVSLENNPDFVGVAQSLFKTDDRLIVLSSDGEEGAEAADALVRAGFRRVYNIRHGFWGDPLVSKEHQKLAERLSPHSGQRGRVNGWVYWGLPVVYAMDPRYVYPPDLKRMQTLK